MQGEESGSATKRDEADEDGRTLLVRVSGRDRPGITAALLAALASARADVYDIEQVTTRGRLSLDLLVSMPEDDSGLKELLYLGWERDLEIDFEMVEPRDERERSAGSDRHAITVMGQRLTAAALAAVAKAIADADANIDRITRLSRYPVVSYELVVAGGAPDQLRANLVDAAAWHAVDVAVQREGLERRAKRLVVIDVDSTLIQDEVIELLAEELGHGREVREITQRAMAGEIDFESALRDRVALLEGLEVETLEKVRDRIRLTPGARTFSRTLRRLGFRIAIVSGGFTAFTDNLQDRLGIDHAFANRLEVVDGRLTGRLEGRVIDRVAKADILEEVAASEGIPLEQTVAIGDGANDLDMLTRAGLGIAFNAKPAVREAADTAVSVPYLDAVLFVLGIRREDVEAADAGDPDASEPVPVPGTPPV